MYNEGVTTGIFSYSFYLLNSFYYNNYFKDYFDIYVGLVTGKEDVYKNEELGNIEVLNGEDKIDKYIYIENYPCENEEINKRIKNDFFTKINFKEIYSPSFYLTGLEELSRFANWDLRSFHWEIKYTKPFLVCIRLSSNILGSAF